MLLYSEKLEIKGNLRISLTELITQADVNLGFDSLSLLCEDRQILDPEKI
jgi:hypothetical protein